MDKRGKNEQKIKVNYEEYEKEELEKKGREYISKKFLDK